MPVAHELLARFVPKPEAQRFQTGEEREGFHLLEEQVGAMAALKVIVRDARAEVVDVVVADISGEPLENLRQLIE